MSAHSELLKMGITHVYLPLYSQITQSLSQIREIISDPNLTDLIASNSAAQFYRLKITQGTEAAASLIHQNTYTLNRKGCVQFLPCSQIYSSVHYPEISEFKASVPRLQFLIGEEELSSGKYVYELSGEGFGIFETFAILTPVNLHIKGKRIKLKAATHYTPERKKFAFRGAFEVPPGFIIQELQVKPRKNGPALKNLSMAVFRVHSNSRSASDKTRVLTNANVCTLMDDEIIRINFPVTEQNCNTVALTDTLIKEMIYNLEVERDFTINELARKYPSNTTH